MATRSQPAVNRRHPRREREIVTDGHSGDVKLAETTKKRVESGLTRAAANTDGIG